MLRKRKPSASARRIPIRPAAVTASGMSPSPQALSMGGRFPSATITRSSLLRAAMAAASPAGPPPITNTSVSNIVFKTTLFSRPRCSQGDGVFRATLFQATVFSRSIAVSRSMLFSRPQHPQDHGVFRGHGSRHGVSTALHVRRTLCQPDRFGPELGGMMSQVNHLPNPAREFLDLFGLHDQRWRRDSQHHVLLPHICINTR